MPGITDIRIQHPVMNRVQKAGLDVPQVAVTTAPTWEPVEPSAIRFGATRPLFGTAEKAEYQDLKAQAVAQRKALPSLLQMSHGVNGDVGIQQMQEMMALVKASPATEAMLAEGTKAQEKAFLDTIFEMESLTRELDRQYVNTEPNPTLHNKLANMAQMAFDLPEPQLQRLFFNGPRDLYHKRNNYENAFLKPFLTIEDPAKRDALIEALFTPNADINYLCYKLLPLMTPSPRRDNLIRRIATEQADWRSYQAIELFPLVSDATLRDQLIEKQLRNPGEHHRGEAIQGLQWYSDPVKKDQLIESLFTTPQYSEHYEKSVAALGWMSNTERRDQLIREMTGDDQKAKQKYRFYDGLASLGFLSDPVERDQRIEQYVFATPVEDQGKKTADELHISALHEHVAPSLKRMSNAARRDACIEKMMQTLDSQGHNEYKIVNEVTRLLPEMEDTAKRDFALDIILAKRYFQHDYELDFTSLLLSLKNPTPKTIELQNQYMADTFGNNYQGAMRSIEKYFPLIPTPEQRDQIIEKICTHPNWQTRLYSGYALQYHSSPERQLVLFTALMTEKDSLVKDYAGSAARKVKDPNVFKTLMELMEKDQKDYSTLRKAQVMAVHNPNIEERKKSILAFLESPDNYEKRELAIRALDSIEDLPLRDQLLKKYADDADYRVRQAVAEQLKLVSNPELRDALAEKLSQDPQSRDIQIAVCDILPSIADKAKRNTIIDRLNEHSDWTVRKANQETTMKCKIVEPMIAFIEAHPTYMTHFQAVKAQLDPEGLVSLSDALFTLNNLAGMDNDAGRMTEIFKTFYSLRARTMEQPSLLFKPEDTEKCTPANVAYYFTYSARSILTALAIVGPEKVKTLCDQGRLGEIAGKVYEEVTRELTPEYKLRQDAMKVIQTLSNLPNATPDDALKAMDYVGFYHFEARQQKMVDWNKFMAQVDLMQAQGKLDFDLLKPEAIVTSELEIRPGWVEAMFQIKLGKEYPDTAE